MPYIIHPRRMRTIVAALVGSASLIGCVPAVAGAACPSNPTTTALAQFGDNAAYTLLPGGSFESGAPGWSLTGAEVASAAGATGGAGSLVIEPNGVAVSPAFCVSSEYPSFRFFARQLSGGGGDRRGGGDGGGGRGGRDGGGGSRGGGDSGGGLSGSSLSVSLRWTDPSGSSHDIDVASLQPGSGWTLSPVLNLASALPLWMQQSTLNVKLVFEANGGSWAIDDVFIDPYRR